MFATLTSVGATAFAQSQGAAELSATERRELARAHFRAGTRYFDLRRYADAAIEFERVFELTEQRALFYNAGRAWEAAGRAREALRAYQRFLEGDTPGVDRASVERAMRALQARAAEEERAAAQRASAGCPEPSPSASPASVTGTTPSATPGASERASASLLQLQTRVTFQHRTLDVAAPWVMLGVGAVFGGLAAWQAISYGIDAGRVTSATQWSQELTIAQDSAREASRNAILAGVAGGIFVTTGALWFALRGPGERREEILRVAWVAPMHNGLTLGGRF